MSDASTWPTWPCPRCEVVQTARVEPQDRRCLACVQAAHTLPRDRADRRETLAAAGWPARHLRPFVEPDPWPRDPERWSHVDLATWDGTPPSVLLTGDVGTGKTMLGTELAWRLWCAGRSVAYARGADLVRAVFTGRGQGFETVDMLLVDDLDRGVAGDAIEAVWVVLDARYAAGRVTVATSNRTLPALYDWHASMADRWTEGPVVVLRGASRRGT